MIKPLIWMFGTKNFKEHYFRLLKIYLKFMVVAAILLVLYKGLELSLQWELGITVGLLACVIIPMLINQGYFWELTEETINRECDYTASNVYNGRVSEVYKIHLPIWNTKKFLWRGISSIVASIILYIPVVTLYTYSMFQMADKNTGIYSIPFFSAYSFDVTPVMLACLLIYFVTPGLLWNYANRNSIMSILNIRKAIYVMGNYTGRYFFNVLCFLVYFVADFFIMCMLVKLFGISYMPNMDSNFITLAIFAVYLLITELKYLYLIYVYAYLLGTIAAPCEGLG